MTQRNLVLRARRFARYVALILVAGVLLGPALASAQTKEHAAVTRARQLYQQGVSAFDAGEYEKAERLLRQSYQTHPHPVTLRNLATALERLERRADACNELARLIRVHATSDEKGNAERTLANLSERVGQLEIVTNLRGADVKVDDTWIGVSPVPEWYVEPGEHTVTANKQGFDEARATATVAAKEKKSVSLSLPPTDTGMPGAGLGTGTDPGANGGTGGGLKPKTIALIAGAGLTVVGAGVGIAYHLRAGSAADDVDSLKADATAELGRNCRDADETPKCAELSEAIDRRDDSQTIRNVGLIAGGVFAVATVVTFFAWPDETRTSGSLVPVAAVTPEGASFSLSGSF